MNKDMKNEQILDLARKIGEQVCISANPRATAVRLVNKLLPGEDGEQVVCEIMEGMADYDKRLKLLEAGPQKRFSEHMNEVFEEMDLSDEERVMRRNEIILGMMMKLKAELRKIGVFKTGVKENEEIIQLLRKNAVLYHAAVLNQKEQEAAMDELFDATLNIMRVDDKFRDTLMDNFVKGNMSTGTAPKALDKNDCALSCAVAKYVAVRKCEQEGLVDTDVAVGPVSARMIGVTAAHERDALAAYYNHGVGSKPRNVLRKMTGMACHIANSVIALDLARNAGAAAAGVAGSIAAAAGATGVLAVAAPVIAGVAAAGAAGYLLRGAAKETTKMLKPVTDFVADKVADAWEVARRWGHEHIVEPVETVYNNVSELVQKKILNPIKTKIKETKEFLAKETTIGRALSKSNSRFKAFKNRFDPVPGL